MPGIRQRMPATLPPYAQWFQLVDPGLLTNKTIRQYLLAHNAEQWPEIVKLTLLYGILSLQKQYGSHALPVQDLRDIVGQNKVAASVEQSIPGIEKQLADLRAEVLSFQQDLGSSGNSASQPPVRPQPANTATNRPSVPKAAPEMSPPTRQPRVSFAEGGSSRPDSQASVRPPVAEPSGNRDTIRRVFRRPPVEHGQPGVHFQKIDRTPTSNKTGGQGNPNVHFTKVVKQPVVRGRAYIPSGDEALAMALKQAAIAAAKMNGEAYEPGEGEEDESAVNYPDWYRKHATEPSSVPSGPSYPDWWGHEVFVPPPRKAKKAPRAPPRLAHSIPKEDPRARQLYEDDMVTAEYLGVPGSGYSQRATMPRQQITSMDEVSGGRIFGPESDGVGVAVPVVSDEVDRRPTEALSVPIPVVEPAVQGPGRGSGVNTPSGQAESSDQGSGRRQSAGWVATIPVSEVGKRPRRTSTSSRAESVAATVRTDRSEGERERGRRGSLTEGEEARPGGQRSRENLRGGAASRGGGGAAGKKKVPVRSRVRAEIEAQRRYEEQKAAARLKAAQELLARPRRGSSEESSPAQSAVTSPRSAVGRIADQFLGDPWMAHFQDPSGSTTPAFERFGLTERSPEPSFVPSGTLLAAAAAASVLLSRRSPEAEQTARSSPADSQSALNRGFREAPAQSEEPGEPGNQENQEQTPADGASNVAEVLDRTASAAPEGENVDPSSRDRRALDEEGSADPEPGNGDRREEERVPGAAPHAALSRGPEGSVRSEASKGSEKGSESAQPEELRGLPGGRSSEASESPSLSSFTSFTTTGSLDETGVQSTADSEQVA